MASMMSDVKLFTSVTLKGIQQYPEQLL